MRQEPETRVDQLARDVIGAAIRVHQALGPGYLESVYERALCHELARMLVPFVCQHRVLVMYEGQPVGEHRLDLLVDNVLIVELKAVEDIASIHRQTVKSYLKATGLQLALLLNFNVPLMKQGIERIIYTHG